MLATRRLISVDLMSSDWRRANARSRCVSVAARSAEVEAASMKRAMSSDRSVAMRLRTRSSEPMMPVKRLLKSWAMPPVSWPIASIF